MSKARTTLDEINADGGLARTASALDTVPAAGTEYPPEADRYHLYVAFGCPWAAGALTALYLKGLDHVISHSVVHPTWCRTRPDDADDKHIGWQFKNPGDAPVSNPEGVGSFECDDALIPDPVFNATTLRDAYLAGGADPGKYTTPALLCKKTKKMLCNESLLILRMLDSQFQDLARNPGLCLFPPEKEPSLVAINEWVYPNLNNGVYRAGFCRSQSAYDTAVTDVFAALDRLEEIFGTNPYVGGDSLTYMDIRIYHTLVRFDPVYITYFKTNLRRIVDYPNLLAFLRRMAQHEGVKRATNIRHIKMHYYTSHPAFNAYAIIPVYDGPDIGL